MPANRLVPRVVGSVNPSKAPTSRKLTWAAWTVSRKPTSMSANAREQRRQPLQHLAAAQFLGVVDHHFDAQDAAALVVDFQRQIAPLDLEDGEIVALRLHHFDALGLLASPLCAVMRAMRKTEDRL